MNYFYPQRKWREPNKDPKLIDSPIALTSAPALTSSTATL